MKTKTTKNEFAVAQRATDKKTAQLRTIDQSTILERVQTALANEGLNINLYLIQKVIQAEQQACTEFLAEGKKIVKWNYLTLYTTKMPRRKLKCPMDGKTYDVPENMRVIVRVGEGLRKVLQKPEKVSETALGNKNSTTATPKTSERTRLYADRFVKEPDNQTATSATTRDKKRHETQRNGAGQVGGNAESKRAETATAAATAEEVSR